MFALCLVLFSAGIYAKDLHIKQSDLDEMKDEEIGFFDIYKFDDKHSLAKDRYARHIELATESVLEHLLSEINKKYPSSKKTQNGNIPKLLRKLKKRINVMNKKTRKHKTKLNRHNLNTNKTENEIRLTTMKQEMIRSIERNKYL